MSGTNNLLTCDNLSKWYVANGTEFCAVDHVTLRIRAGESVGLVGESGSGKSTIAKMITQFERPDEGRILLGGAGGTDAGSAQDITHVRGRVRRNVYQRVQMVFQNPMDSFDPRRTIRSALLETARNYGAGRRAGELVDRVLQQVGMKSELANRYRHQLSGGECQRAAIARALIVNPSLLICDEVTSALDVSVQAQIINLIRDLHENSNLSLLVISHDLAVVGLLCTRVIVLRNGKVVEEGSAADVLEHPVHPYTQMLVRAARQASGIDGIGGGIDGEGDAGEVSSDSQDGAVSSDGLPQPSPVSLDVSHEEPSPDIQAESPKEVSR